MTVYFGQEPTTAIQIILSTRNVNLLPARHDGAIILVASQYMTHQLPAGISYLMPYVKFEGNSWNIVEIFQNGCRMISFV